MYTLNNHYPTNQGQDNHASFNDYSEAFRFACECAEAALSFGLISRHYIDGVQVAFSDGEQAGLIQ